MKGQPGTMKSFFPPSTIATKPLRQPPGGLTHLLAGLRHEVIDTAAKRAEPASAP